MIYQQHQKLESDVQLTQFTLIGIWMASLPLFRNTISWTVLSVHVINNLGAEKEESLKGKIKGRTLHSVSPKGLRSPVMTAGALLGLHLQNAIKSIERTGNTGHREPNPISILVHSIS